jgi:hypothetical protein
MRTKRSTRRRVPRRPITVFKPCGNGSAKNAPSAASAGARSG